jgi:hypothetical protein
LPPPPPRWRRRNNHPTSPKKLAAACGYDHAPDEDNSGNGQNIFADDAAAGRGTKNWSADFKLHTPLQTVVAGRVENGRVNQPASDPASRRADVVLSKNLAGDTGLSVLESHNRSGDMK